MAISKPSKSAKKREYLALQTLGENLIGLTREQLASIGLEQNLLDAVLEAKSITSHGALRRQKQLIGKMMRGTDPQPIETALLAFGQGDKLEKKLFRDAETWRDRLLNNSSAAVAAYRDMLGTERTDVGRLVASLKDDQPERVRRELQRRIFRAIHSDLMAKMHRGQD